VGDFDLAGLGLGDREVAAGATCSTPVAEFWLLSSTLETGGPADDAGGDAWIGCAPETDGAAAGAPAGGGFVDAPFIEMQPETETRTMHPTIISECIDYSVATSNL
jgi:hypothetical protein